MKGSRGTRDIKGSIGVVLRKNHIRPLGETKEG